MLNPNSELQVTVTRIGALQPNPRNARKHSREQIRQIAQSIRTFGWTNPILVDDSSVVLAGHGRLEAAKLLELENVPVIRLSQLNEHQRRAYVLADNKLAENAGWDADLLAMELGALTAMDLDFDIEVTGFTDAEIDIHLGAAQNSEPDHLDDIPDTPPAPVSQPGDFWRLGRHHISCADARDSSAYAQVMQGEQARLVFTDPPYNVGIAGNVTTSRAHGEFAMASGEMNEDEFTAFLTQALGHARAWSLDGALLYVAMDWRHIFELLCASRKAGLTLKNLCVWSKTNGGMGSFYRSAHELFALFKSGDARHVNNVELGKHGRNRTNVWSYAGMNAFNAERDEALRLHPTIKPVELVADAILDASRRDEIILDPFAGAGTSLLAAERTGRRARLIEIEPRYVDVTLQRWSRMTNEDPVRASDGRKFSELVEAGGRDD